VVFSPGSFGTRTSNTSTYRELASNGYVVCAIDHPYHSFYTTDVGGKLTLISWSFLTRAACPSMCAVAMVAACADGAMTKLHAASPFAEYPAGVA